jgi:transcriptional antiterminator NusG
MTEIKVPASELQVLPQEERAKLNKEQLEQKAEPAWYVVRAIGGKENKVKEYIESEIRHLHLEDRIFQVLIPTEKVFTVRNGKKVSKERVSYPGYVLVECIFTGDVPYILRNTPNVLGFLGDTKEDNKKMNATPLRPQEVSRILGRVDEISAGEEEMEVLYSVGETVKVTDGPFSGFPGVVDSIDADRKKVTVSVKIFGRKTPMELSFTQVEKE